MVHTAALQLLLQTPSGNDSVELGVSPALPDLLGFALRIIERMAQDHKLI